MSDLEKDKNVQIGGESKHEKFANTMVKVSKSTEYKYATQEQRGLIVEAVRKCYSNQN